MRTFVILFSLILFGCKKEPFCGCEPKPPTWVDIKPILLNHGCIGCHNSNNMQGYVNLDSSTGVIHEIVRGTFYNSIRVPSGGVYALMPPYNSTYIMMDSLEIRKFIDWGLNDYKIK